MRILVLGGSGFIGRHVARTFAEAGEDVTILTRSQISHGRPPVRHVVRDLLEMQSKDFDLLCNNVDSIYHFAWTTIPASANENPLGDIFDNVKIMIGLLEALRRRGGGQLIFASSGGTVYGNASRLPIAEDCSLEPITAYGVSKVAAEKYMQLYRFLHNVETTVLRIANPYGAGQSATRQQGAVATFIHRALAGQTIEIWGDGEVVRDFVYIKDVVSAAVSLSHKSPTTCGQMPVFNIGSGIGASVNDVLGLIEDEVGRPIAIERKAARRFDVPASVLDISRARRVLGWIPRTDLRSGIEMMVADLRGDDQRLFTS